MYLRGQYFSVSKRSMIMNNPVVTHISNTLANTLANILATPANNPVVTHTHTHIQKKKNTYKIQGIILLSERHTLSQKSQCAGTFNM